jgi:hypothetical protein
MSTTAVIITSIMETDPKKKADSMTAILDAGTGALGHGS